MKAKCGRCTLHWCPRCLLNRYGEEVATVTRKPGWPCPRCRGDCNCSNCRKVCPHAPRAVHASCAVTHAGLLPLLPAARSCAPSSAQHTLVFQSFSLPAACRQHIAQFDEAHGLHKAYAGLLCLCGGAETGPGGNGHPGRHVQGGRLQLRVRPAHQESARQAAALRTVSGRKGACHLAVSHRLRATVSYLACSA